jgi:hypothetical protein
MRRVRGSSGLVSSGLVLGLLIGAGVLAACSSSPSNPSAGSTTSTVGSSTSTTSSAAGAPCTHHAIAAAATSDTSLGPVDAVVGFGCSGTWAYANVTVGSGSGAYDAVIVLQAQGSSWSVADRASACSGHLVPSDISKQACTTS